MWRSPSDLAATLALIARAKNFGEEALEPIGRNGFLPKALGVGNIKAAIAYLETRPDPIKAMSLQVAIRFLGAYPGEALNGPEASKLVEICAGAIAREGRQGAPINMSHMDQLGDEAFGAASKALLDNGWIGPKAGEILARAKLGGASWSRALELAQTPIESFKIRAWRAAFQDGEAWPEIPEGVGLAGEQDCVMEALRACSAAGGQAPAEELIRQAAEQGCLGAKELAKLCEPTPSHAAGFDPEQQTPLDRLVELARSEHRLIDFFGERKSIEAFFIAAAASSGFWTMPTVQSWRKSNAAIGAADLCAAIGMFSEARAAIDAGAQIHWLDSPDTFAYALASLAGAGAYGVKMLQRIEPSAAATIVERELSAASGIIERLAPRLGAAQEFGAAMESETRERMGSFASSTLIGTRILEWTQRVGPRLEAIELRSCLPKAPQSASPRQPRARL